MTKRQLNSHLDPKEATQVKWIGLSWDQRTNVWAITCPHCDEVFKPSTTMRRSQSFSCPKCLGESFVKDYDAFPG
ncbi:MAG: hypothetical protein WC511_02300 [Candidatus Pacearchaeota archaeon]